MKRKRWNIVYFIREGAHSIVTHGLMSFAAVSMIVACLIIMGSFSLMAINMDYMMGQLESDHEFLAYIEETYTDDQIAVLYQQVQAVENVDRVVLVSKEEAKQRYLEGRETQGLYAGLPDEVFRDRLSIHVVDLTLFEQTVKQVEGLNGVVNLRAETELAGWFVTIRNVAAALATILVVILVTISLFIMTNTIKLATFTRREEIAIMKMCGATNSFVRWPFVIEGLLLGIIGALVAFFLQWIIYVVVYQAIENSGAITVFPMVSFQSLIPHVSGAFFLSGTIIGALGSAMAIRKFLRV